ETFDEIIDDNEVCQSTSMDKEPTEDNPWVFEDGCPITEVTGQTPPTTGPDGEVYIAYDVVQSVEDAPANMISQHFGIMPFTGSDNLSSITLPDKYSFFEPKIFKGLENLEAVYIENNPDLYSEDGILYEKKTDNLAYYPSGLLTKDFVLPKHIEHINGWECVLYGNRTETLTLHDNVTFDYGAFGCLTGLKNIVIDGENPSYSVSDGVVYNSSETALLVYPAGKEATTYTTPNDVAIIEEYAFMNQQHIEHLIISEGVEGILDHAFFAIPSLRTVDIASTVEYILPGNFSQEPDVLGNLETIILRKDNEVFHAPGINVRETDTLEIYVPDTLIAAYEEDVWWQHYADNFIPLSELEE
ncbi:MAG: leucine-rich repeat protein, partial [Bacillota bacterium]